jgi:HAD superfamily hydrolase (TIGR01509 family)
LGHSTLYVDAVPTLHALRERGVSTAVICNGSAFVRPWLDSSALIEAADVVIVSAEESVAKPDAAIFRLAATRLGVECGTTCWFVDDQPDYLAGARSSGIRCWRIARTDMPAMIDETFEVISNLTPIVDEVERLAG